MPSIEVNFWAVLVAALLNMIIGGAWYSFKLFGRPWMKYVDKTEEELQGGAGPGYVGMTLASVIMAYVLAHFVSYSEATGLVEGALVGFWAWLGFIATSMSGSWLFEGRPKGLYAINTGYYLVSLPIMSALLALWR